MEKLCQYILKVILFAYRNAKVVKPYLYMKQSLLDQNLAYFQELLLDCFRKFWKYEICQDILKILSRKSSSFIWILWPPYLQHLPKITVGILHECLVSLKHKILLSTYVLSCFLFYSVITIFLIVVLNSTWRKFIFVIVSILTFV